MPNYVRVYTGYGKLDAETVRLFLVSLGIDALAIGESAGAMYGLTIPPMGQVDIFVPVEQEEEALQILADMEAGKYETASETDETDAAETGGEPGEDPQPDDSAS